MIRITLQTRNESSRKGLHRGDALRRLAGRVLAGEGADGAFELSVLFCDDPFIAELNKTYRGKRGPTDVLAFDQEPAETPDGARVLGDIVISLETVERFCKGDPAAMRAEVRLLFCHGLLHLLGHEHGTPEGRKAMQERQAGHLGVSPALAWHGRKPA